MDAILGQISMFAANFAPREWALCDGQLLSISQNTALFAILGTTYGGDGRTTFALPDLRGRGPIHAGGGPGLSNRSLGEKSGVEAVTLTVNEMPSHSHTVQISVSNTQGTQHTPVNNFLAAGPTTYNDQATVDARLAGSMANNVGGNQPHTNMPPYLAVNFIICTVGIFPTRD